MRPVPPSRGSRPIRYALSPNRLRFAAPPPAPPRDPAAPQAAASAIPLLHAQRRYRTGRNMQLNLKVREATAATFYAMADAQGWVLGEAFERAVAALQRELAE